jgi:hypothetical protein
MKKPILKAIIFGLPIGIGAGLMFIYFFKLYR